MRLRHLTVCAEVPPDLISEHSDDEDLEDPDVRISGRAACASRSVPILIHGFVRACS